MRGFFLHYICLKLVMEINLKKAYFISLVFSFILPRLDRVDVAIVDYMSLTVSAILGICILIYFNSSNENIKKFSYINFPLFSFFGFFTIALISMFFAINSTESLVSIFKISTILIHVYLIYSLNIYKAFSLNNLLFIISIMLFIEVFASLYPLFSEILPVKKFEFADSNYMKGFTGNKNITAASICLKIPFLIMLINRSKKLFIRILLIVVLTLSVLNLFFLSSRAVFLSLLIIFSFYLLQKLTHEVKKIGLLKSMKRYMYILFVFLVSYYVFDKNSKGEDRSKIQNRVLSINSSDESTSQRLRYYKQAIKYSFQNPIMGVGIGNWRIKSIDIDKDNIYSYIIPYNTHNDFLEVLAETNLAGFIFYLLIFISIFMILFKGYLNAKDLNLRDSISLCTLALIVYFVDANLNFPMYRPIMQINLLIIITISIFLYQNSLTDENK